MKTMAAFIAGVALAAAAAATGQAPGDPLEELTLRVAALEESSAAQATEIDRINRRHREQLGIEFDLRVADVKALSRCGKMREPWERACYLRMEKRRLP